MQKNGWFIRFGHNGHANFAFRHHGAVADKLLNCCTCSKTTQATPLLTLQCHISCRQMYPILTSHDIIMKCTSTSLVNKRRSIWSWWCRTFQCFSNITYSLYKSSDDHSDVELLQLNWWRCVQLVHLADERVSICAGSIVPAIPSILVQQHTMHRRARVWFAVCPARVWHRSHSTLFNPHPATTASHVTATRPPALRTVILWQTQTYTNHTSLTFNDSRSQAYCSRVLIGSGVFFRERYVHRGP